MAGVFEFSNFGSPEISYKGSAGDGYEGSVVTAKDIGSITGLSTEELTSPKSYKVGATLIKVLQDAYDLGVEVGKARRSEELRELLGVGKAIRYELVRKD